MTLSSSLAGPAMLVVALEVVSKLSVKRRRRGKLAIRAKPQALDRSRALSMVTDLSQGKTFIAFTFLIIISKINMAKLHFIISREKLFRDAISKCALLDTILAQ